MSDILHQIFSRGCQNHKCISWILTRNAVAMYRLVLTWIISFPTLVPAYLKFTIRLALFLLGVHLAYLINRGKSSFLDVPK